MASAKNQPRLGKGLSALIGLPKPQPVKIPTAPAPTPVKPPTKEVPPAPAKAPAPVVPQETPPKKLPAPVVPAPATHVPRGTSPDPVVAAPASPPAPVAAAPPAKPMPITELPVAQLRPNSHQPRQRFAEAALRSLADSIRREGVMQPLVVRPTGDPAIPYEIVAGERRWRAAQLAGAAMVPVVVRTLSEEQSAEWALVENLQREDLNPIEKAEAFERMAKDFSLTHQAVADRVGLDRATVTNLLRLLTLGAECRKLVEDGLLSMGHARAIAGLASHDLQKNLATRAIRENWSVRRMEAEVKQAQEPAKPATAEVAKPALNSSYLADLEKQIAIQLKTKVQIKTGRKKGSGLMSISFHSLDEFDTILERLGVAVD